MCDSDALIATFGVISLNNDGFQQVVRVGVEPVGDGYVTRPLEHLKPYVQPSSWCASLRQHLASMRNAGYSNRDLYSKVRKCGYWMP